MAHLQIRGFQRTQSRTVAYLRPGFESGRVRICILVFCICTFGPLLLIRTLNAGQNWQSIPAKNICLTNLPDLGSRSNNSLWHTSDWHQQLPAHLNNLNRKQVELGTISNLKWTWSKSHAQITQAIKQVYPGDQRNGIFLENAEDLRNI